MTQTTKISSHRLQHTRKSRYPRCKTHLSDCTNRSKITATAVFVYGSTQGYFRIRPGVLIFLRFAVKIVGLEQHKKIAQLLTLSIHRFCSVPVESGRIR